MNKRIRVDLGDRRGFTIIEILGVAALLGLLALLVAPSVSGGINKTKLGSAKHSVALMRDALQRYNVSGPSRYPVAAKVLAEEAPAPGDTGFNHLVSEYWRPPASTQRSYEFLQYSTNPEGSNFALCVRARDQEHTLLRTDSTGAITAGLNVQPGPDEDNFCRPQGVELVTGFTLVKASTTALSPSGGGLINNVELTAISPSLTWKVSIKNGSETIRTYPGNGSTHVSVEWDGHDSHGAEVPDGVYQWVISAPNYPDANGSVKVDRVPLQLGLVDFVGNTYGSTPSIAVIQWKLSKAVESQICYGTTSGGPYNLCTTSSSTPLNFHSAILSGLSNSTTYYYQITGRDAAGHSASSQGSFQTTDPVSCPSRVIWKLPPSVTFSASQEYVIHFGYVDCHGNFLNRANSAFFTHETNQPGANWRSTWIGSFSGLFKIDEAAQEYTFRIPIGYLSSGTVVILGAEMGAGTGEPGESSSFLRSYSSVYVAP